MSRQLEVDTPWAPDPANKAAATTDGVIMGPRMRVVTELIHSAAGTDATVLIWGESGVGKELLARILHEGSPRAHGPFVKVNCAALPSELLESELFGYERGAFTGAHRQKPGKFELANNGTLVLDEIGEMPLPLQAKLLHVLQDGQFSRLGSRCDIRVDVRVVAVTNKHLAKLVERGQFREDLYYRVNVVNIHVPPLRECPEEIPLLVGHFVAQYAKHYGRSAVRLSPQTVQRFLEHSWPGNVRELENLVKRIIVLNDEQSAIDELTASRSESNGHDGRAALPRNGHVPAQAEAFRQETGERPGLKEIGRQAVAEAERAAMHAALDEVHWNRGEAARLLKISYTALLYKIKQYGLGRQDGFASTGR